MATLYLASWGTIKLFSKVTIPVTSLPALYMGSNFSISLCSYVSYHYRLLADARASLVAQLAKDLPAMQETWGRSLGWEDPLEMGKVTGLENSMDCIVHGVTKCRAWLSDFHFTSRYEMISIVISVSISYMANDVEHLFMCTLTICMLLEDFHLGSTTQQLHSFGPIMSQLWLQCAPSVKWG